MDQCRRKGRLEMMILSMKLSKKRLAALALVAAAGIYLGTAGVGKAISALGGAQSSPAAQVATTAERIEYLEHFGYQTGSEPKRIVEVMIPEQFDQRYEAYAQVMQADGFDLAEHKGEICKLYQYQVTNYPGSEEASISMLVRGEEVIGALVSPGGSNVVHSLSDNPLARQEALAE